MNIHNSFLLKRIDDGIALLESQGEVVSDSNATIDLSGYGLQVELKGSQHGEYAVDTRTGMVVDARISADIEGVLHMAGNDFPTTIDLNLKMTGRKAD
jgi:hypothetical protein